MKNRKRSTVITIITMAIVVAAIVIGFIGLQRRMSSKANNSSERDEEITKLISADFENDYPPTAREVLYYYSRFLKCYYNDDLTDEELTKLATNNQKLFDEELIEKNPLDSYIASLKEEIKKNKADKTTLVNWTVQDASDAEKEKKGGYNFNNLKASYFLKTGNKFTKSYEKFYIREDENGRWKILFWEVTDKF